MFDHRNWRKNYLVNVLVSNAIAHCLLMWQVMTHSYGNEHNPLSETSRRMMNYLLTGSCLVTGVLLTPEKRSRRSKEEERLMKKLIGTKKTKYCTSRFDDAMQWVMFNFNDTHAHLHKKAVWGNDSANYFINSLELYTSCIISKLKYIQTYKKFDLINWLLLL